MRSFAEVLYRLSADTLLAMAQKRKAEPGRLKSVYSKRQLATALATEFMRANSIASGLERCNGRQLRALQIAVSLYQRNEFVPFEEILEAVGGEENRAVLEEALEGLQALGLAFPLAEGVYLPEGVSEQTPVPVSERHLLERCLNLYDAATTKNIAGTLGLAPSKNTKGAAVEAILSYLLAPDLLSRLEPPLDEEEKAVLGYVMGSGGAAPATSVAEETIPNSRGYFYRYDWQRRWQNGSRENGIERLLARGILHMTYGGYSYNLLLMIPGDLLRKLHSRQESALWSRPLSAELLTETPRHISAHTSLLRDVVAALGFVSGQEAARTNTGYMHRTALKNLMRHLHLPDERYAAFVYALCREAQLIQASGEKMLYGVTAQGLAWLTWDEPTQWRTLFEAWFSGTLWAEMYEDALKKTTAMRPAELIQETRRYLLHLLAEPPFGAWIERETLENAYFLRHPLTLRQGHLYGADMVPSVPFLLKNMAQNSLFWLGALELGWDTPPPAEPEEKIRLSARLKGVAEEELPEPQKPIGVRLTALGARLLGLQGAPEAERTPREEHFILQATGEVYLSPYLRSDLLYRLYSVAEIPAKGASTTNVILTRESLRRAMDKGETAQNLIDFLKAHSRVGVPQNIDYLIQEVGAKHGHIHVGKASFYVQVASPLLMQELKSRKELKRYFVRELTDTIALLEGETLERILRDLRKAGYMPISDEDSAENPKTAESQKPAPPPPPKPSPLLQKAPPGAQKLLQALPWERIREEDGKAWGEAQAEGGGKPPPVKPPNNAQTVQNLIRFLVAQGVQKSMTLELAHEDPQTGNIGVYIVEPRRAGEERFQAWDLEAEEMQLFFYAQTLWARAISR